MTTELDLLADLHKDAERQGPGGTAETLRAIELARLEPSEPLEVADIGCGTGASALQLARSLNARVTAVDFLAPFVDVLSAKIQKEGLADRIEPLVGSMEELPFEPGSLDVIWSEGAIYNMGFERGVKEWRHFLKPGGVLAVSEVTWITAERPPEIQAYWDSGYPEIDTASGKLSVLEKNGYSPLGYFVLPESCWMKNYYRPLQKRFAGFLERHAHSEAARGLVAAEEEEIALYAEYRAYYSYGFYLARRPI